MGAFHQQADKKADKKAAEADNKADEKAAARGAIDSNAMLGPRKRTRKTSSSGSITPTLRSNQSHSQSSESSSDGKRNNAETQTAGEFDAYCLESDSISLHVTEETIKKDK
ncbi:hypothetical protein L2E82_42532 [Cichorium intybus]|uniref:Uncharacterized protein n=1 Tax=Cichorium intybus TaxID=13427 RepID=A0ACB8ZM77_CICIN|nr:hypothetical protein L2E82_42532 [Cichorium intybus]